MEILGVGVHCGPVVARWIGVEGRAVNTALGQVS